VLSGAVCSHACISQRTATDSPHGFAPRSLLREASALADPTQRGFVQGKAAKYAQHAVEVRGRWQAALEHAVGLARYDVERFHYDAAQKRLLAAIEGFMSLVRHAAVVADHLPAVTCCRRH